MGKQMQLVAEVIDVRFQRWMELARRDPLIPLQSSFQRQSLKLEK